MTLRRGRRGALSGGGEGREAALAGLAPVPRRASLPAAGSGARLLGAGGRGGGGAGGRVGPAARAPPGGPSSQRGAEGGFAGRRGVGSRSERLPEAGAEGLAEPGGPSPAAHLELARRVFPKDGGILSSDSPPAAFLKSPGFHVNLCQLSQAMCGICFYNSSLVTSQTLS